jgi:hypothetical protein
MGLAAPPRVSMETRGGAVFPEGLARAMLVPSPPCGLTDLAEPYEIPEASRWELACGEGCVSR